MIGIGLLLVSGLGCATTAELNDPFPPALSSPHLSAQGESRSAASRAASHVIRAQVSEPTITDVIARPLSGFETVDANWSSTYAPQFDDEAWLRRLPPVTPPMPLEFNAPLSVAERFDGKVGPRSGYPFDLLKDMGRDYGGFYSLQSLPPLAIAFGGAAAMANTPFDASIREVLQENLVYTPSDDYADFLHEHSFLGDGFYLIPAYAVLAFVGKGLGDEPLAPVVGEWAERSFRGIAVGGPALLAAQLLTGGSRPNEVPYGSEWHPLKDNNGVSGHSFIGAVPFMTAARMTEKHWLKLVFFSASLLPGMSRITDNAHYPSQALLGWTLAFVATNSVARTEREQRFVRVRPWVTGETTGIGFEIVR
jgi:membrane-associated phospholipid phosphatase